MSAESRVVRLHIVCPGDRVRFVIGRGQSNIESIRTRSQAHISLTPTSTGSQIVTVWASEKLASLHPSTFSASIALLTYCISPCEEGSVTVTLVLDEQSFNLDWLDSNGQFRILRKSRFHGVPLTDVHVTNCCPYYRLEITGPYQAVRATYCRILHQLRRHVFCL